MVNITKTFGSVFANRNVSFKVKRGEVYALLGENGAGKSTLMNILSGIYAPDGGEVFIHGQKANLSSPKASIDAGIGMIHQHFKLVDVLTAKENVILGRDHSFFINPKKLSRQISDICQKFGLNVDPDKKIYDMSVGEKQTVEILKVLYRGADILILDEPTAVLTPQETAKLFAILRKMKERGCAIIIITHKMHEVLEISDWVTIMRKGESVGSVKTSESTGRELTNLMVGRAVDLSIERVHTDFNENLLQVRNLTVFDDSGVRKLDRVNFDLQAGEILGVAGVAGSGQKELCESIAGLQPVGNGQIRYRGQNIVGQSSRQIIEQGITMSFIPEDRLGMGLVASMDMVDNIILKDYYTQKGLLLDRKPAASRAQDLIGKLNIQTPGIHHPVKQLSGGNIQKVLLGREIESDPHLLVTAYPTRGLDVGASHVIYDLLNEQKRRGVGLLYVGEDLDVLMELCDRIMVLCDGKVTGVVQANEISKEELGLLMAGGELETTEAESTLD
jgi:simple sugar transport system ATP-binding protein